MTLRTYRNPTVFQARMMLDDLTNETDTVVEDLTAFAMVSVQRVRSPSRRFP